MNNNRKFCLSCILAAAFLSTGCAEVIQKDLSKLNVILIAPSNNVSIPDSVALTFAWDSLAGAQTYTLQVVTPSFDSVVQLLADTTVYGTYLSLPSFNSPGTFQWRVMASNNTSSTSFSGPWNFQVP